MQSRTTPWNAGDLFKQLNTSTHWSAERRGLQKTRTQLRMYRLRFLDLSDYLDFRADVERLRT